MKKIKLNTFLLELLILTITIVNTSAQTNRYCAPLDDKLFLSATFGELRTDHFHLGIDFKTGGETGKNIYCINDGFVSRIRVSTGGYGNALFVQHPDGYTSVYGHLQEYKGTIADFVKNYQYSKETHTFEIFLKPNDLQVKKGQVIALSGNSGYSFGPHLHFEMRITSTQDPLNVMQFGYDIKDNVAPKLLNLAIYPMNDTSLVMSSCKKVILALEKIGNKYQIQNKEPLVVYGQVGIGIEAYDYLSETNNRCGVYSIEMLRDSNRVFYFELNRVPYSESRYVNSFIDYEDKMINQRYIQKIFIDPNNQLSIYKDVFNNGILAFANNVNDTVLLKIKDTYGNESYLDFELFGKKHNLINPCPFDSLAINVKWNKNFTLTLEGMNLTIPSGALYKDADLIFRSETPCVGCLSPVYAIHNKNVPLHRSYQMSIKTNFELKPELRNKLFIAAISPENTMMSYGGNYKRNVITGKFLQFGKFSVGIDTVSPIVIPLGIYEGKNLSKENRLRFRIKDELSGIAAYNGYIDNQWVLFEYDLKENLLSYRFDAKVSKDKMHNLDLFVSDDRDNLTVYHMKFFY